MNTIKLIITFFFIVNSIQSMDHPDNNKGKIEEIKFLEFSEYLDAEDEELNIEEIEFYIIQTDRFTNPIENEHPNMEGFLLDRLGFRACVNCHSQNNEYKRELIINYAA